VIVFTGAWLAGVAYATFASRGEASSLHSGVVIGALGLALFAAVGPWLLSEWIHGDSDRYVWVINQGYPCSHMGSGPGMLWVYGTSWLAAIGALVYVAASGLTVARGVAGLGVGVAALVTTTAAMFPDPTIFARVLGCL
jgi:hypothetical protein